MRARVLGRPLLIYAASRVVILLAAWTVTIAHPGQQVFHVLGQWDGHWYLKAVTDGYPATLPHDLIGVAAQSPIAFFPAYPALVRFMWWLTPLDPLAAAVIVSFLVGAAVTLVVGRLAKAVTGDEDTAERAVILFCFFPGSIVLSMVYAEGVMLLGATACLLALTRRRWVLAGLAAALASAARANGLVLTLCCAWVAVGAIRRNRDWRALAAPLLAPLGTLAYFLWLQRRTGSFTAWFLVERKGWYEKLDFGSNNWEHAHKFLDHPFKDDNRFILGLGLFFVVGAGYALARSGLPAVLKLYAFATLALVFLSATLGFRPRFLFTAFPLLLPIAVHARGTTFTITASASGAMMTTLLVYYGLQPMGGIAP